MLKLMAAEVAIEIQKDQQTIGALLQLEAMVHTFNNGMVVAS
jgi:hypothetical protein